MTPAIVLSSEGPTTASEKEKAKAPEACVFLVCHGQSAAAAAGRFESGDDEGLSARGRAQAQILQRATEPSTVALRRQQTLRLAAQSRAVRSPAQEPEVAPQSEAPVLRTPA